MSFRRALFAFAMLLALAFSVSAQTFPNPTSACQKCANVNPPNPNHPDCLVAYKNLPGKFCNKFLSGGVAQACCCPVAATCPAGVNLKADTCGCDTPGLPNPGVKPAAPLPAPTAKKTPIWVWILVGVGALVLIIVIWYCCCRGGDEVIVEEPVYVHQQPVYVQQPGYVVAQPTTVVYHDHGYSGGDVVAGAAVGAAVGMIGGVALGAALADAGDHGHYNGGGYGGGYGGEYNGGGGGNGDFAGDF
ncbi:Aste57867_9526 [Aphanomyces stellatus]|uniref:Aste57867_9526 protein n=1 Tax=Aphanomyces stellatus TaxID=120398 RepID=A0A485KNH5_9STRA|nr:hypothetical protein As57867_009489 [Aphanomyces stellatus]VFT86405.1 Aste57867_9526 [Aphanomyces stellatus]